jgi:ribonucleoside-diphosphate reductase subunit M1
MIDCAKLPSEKAQTYADKIRPLGIGVVNFGNCLYRLGIPYDSFDANKINISFCSKMYSMALSSSCKLAEKFGTYEMYPNSPLSRGEYITDSVDSELKDRIAKFGVRNGTLIAHMPTATSSAFNNFSEMMECGTTIQYRKLRAGQYLSINDYLWLALKSENLWTEEIRNKIIAQPGSSLQNLTNEIPEKIRNVFKIQYDINNKTHINFYAERQEFIDQGQSMNIYLQKPVAADITEAIFYAWEKGLKTLCYYLRSFPANIENLSNAKEKENVEECTMCSS